MFHRFVKYMMVNGVRKKYQCSNTNQCNNDGLFIQEQISLTLFNRQTTFFFVFLLLPSREHRSTESQLEVCCCLRQEGQCIKLLGSREDVQVSEEKQRRVSTGSSAEQRTMFILFIFVGKCLFPMSQSAMLSSSSSSGSGFNLLIVQCAFLNK